MTAKGVGQRALGLVVVGDDQVDAELAGAPCRLAGANAAVDRDDQPHAIGVQLLDRDRLQPVAVAHALGKKVDDVAAEHFERASQDDRGGDAVDVVVAVDRDLLALRDRALQPRNGDVHARQPKRIVQVIERGIQEPRGHFGVAEPAHAEQPRDRRMHIQRGGQRGRLLVVTRQVLPEERLHGVSVFTKAVPFFTHARGTCRSARSVVRRRRAPTLRPARAAAPGPRARSPPRRRCARRRAAPG